MTRSTIQAFAAGLFVSAAFLSFYHFTFSHDDSVSLAKAKSVLTKSGYMITKERPPQKQNAALKEVMPNKKKITADINQKENKSKIKTYTLSVQSGMTPGEIADTLQHEGIIQDSSKLVNYLEFNHLNGRIQLGSFVLTSTMSIVQISSTITR